MKNKIIIGSLIVLVILAVTAAVVGWRRQLPVLSKTEFVNVPQIKTVTKIQRIRVPVKEIVVLEKKAVVKKLKLEETLAKDENEQIIATAALPPYEGKTNTLAIMDTSTGEAKIIARQELLPLFAFENKKEIGVLFGATINDGMQANIYGRWDFIRVGSVHIGIYGEMGMNGDGKAMLSAAYRW